MFNLMFALIYKLDVGKYLTSVEFASDQVGKFYRKLSSYE